MSSLILILKSTGALKGMCDENFDFHSFRDLNPYGPLINKMLSTRFDCAEILKF